MTLIYLSFTPYVNRELRHFLRFSTLISKVYNTFIKLYIAFMSTTICVKSLDNYLSNLGLATSIKYTYLKLFLDNGLSSTFYIFKPELSKRLNITTRQIERQLSVLEEYQLFERVHKKSSMIRKSGPALYGKLTPLPIDLLLSSTLTFTARFQEIETGHAYHGEWKHVWVYDVYNHEHKLEIKSHMFISLTEEDMTFFGSLDTGEYLLFDAKIESLDEKDSQRIRMLKRPTNIRSLYQ